MRSSSVVPGIAALVLASVVGCSSQGQAPAETTAPAAPNQVTVANRSYTPQSITIAVGDTVTWMFDDGGMAHDVVADDRAFRSPLMEASSYKHTFTEPGTFTYHCTPHPDMTGTVIVTP
ncbi:cupredoxin domain-containing protein [Rhodococcus sp. G-MC3]|uniref:plastocyanin/azurin family copper-binding protein n=1 Tax=Rhodococcus sp. G-MC3 TaxID=3046209 RepID=UPI0024B976DD|nr:plastocyanin/azurin family copper-binding protein [Rhodococcus sp. G-MC3]MDJ0393472.1 cupredoxin domain-containing protein [Rhodococcus sp. G-MC3]